MCFSNPTELCNTPFWLGVFLLNLLRNQFCFLLKDHTSGLSESNFDHTHRKKAIFMKQFTWQLMCKNFKKTLKINFLYLTRAPTTRPAAPVLLKEGFFEIFTHKLPCKLFHKNGLLSMCMVKI